MSQIIVLDTGILGMLVHPAETGEPRECKAWLKQVVLGGAAVFVPEIADYELRRELLRMKSAVALFAHLGSPPPSCNARCLRWTNQVRPNPAGAAGRGPKGVRISSAPCEP